MLTMRSFDYTDFKTKERLDLLQEASMEAVLVHGRLQFDLDECCFSRGQMEVMEFVADPARPIDLRLLSSNVVAKVIPIMVAFWTPKYGKG